MLRENYSNIFNHITEEQEQEEEDLNYFLNIFNISKNVIALSEFSDISIEDTMESIEELILAIKNENVN
jgi:hypothetical protein